MDVQFYGANCLVLSSKHARVVVDDNLAELGAKSVSKDGDIALFTTSSKSLGQHPKLLIEQPGEYEVSGISIYGIAARGHMDNDGQKTATMYKIILEDMSILVTGHIYPELSDSQLEAIGMVDVIFIPVGGNGYTLDGIGALKLVRKIEPKLVIPTHYDDSKLAFPVPQQPLDQALKSMSMEPKETIQKLKLKGMDLTNVAQLVVLEKS
jgi:L-ascorbate metabolism protein UlaG (beta-lactamase superfamily)